MTAASRRAKANKRFFDLAMEATKATGVDVTSPWGKHRIECALCASGEACCAEGHPLWCEAAAREFSLRGLARAKA
jgi:hypothetical protein